MNGKEKAERHSHTLCRPARYDYFLITTQDKLEPGTFSSLQAIHKYLFDEIYDFAAEIRTVNIAKGNFRFAPVMYLEAALESIDKMPQSTFDEIVEKYVEIYLLAMERSPIKDIEIKHLLKNLAQIFFYSFGSLESSMLNPRF